MTHDGTWWGTILLTTAAIVGWLYIGAAILWLVGVRI